jgi:hypothetical protein
VTTRLTVLLSPSRKLRAEYRWRSPPPVTTPQLVCTERYEPPAGGAPFTSPAGSLTSLSSPR